MPPIICTHGYSQGCFRYFIQGYFTFLPSWTLTQGLFLTIIHFQAIQHDALKLKFLLLSIGNHGLLYFLTLD